MEDERHSDTARLGKGSSSSELWLFTVSLVLGLLLAAASVIVERAALTILCLLLASVFLCSVPFIRRHTDWWWIGPITVACWLTALSVALTQTNTATEGVGVTQAALVRRTSIPKTLAIQYFDSDSELAEAKRDEILAHDETWDVRRDTEAERRHEPFDLGVVQAGLRRGVDGFLILWLKDDIDGFHTVVIRRDRSDANLLPGRFVMPFTSNEGHYVKLARDREEAIVFENHVGSGGFLTLNIAMWNGHMYIDLAREVEKEGACAAYGFADFDGDGTKELVITHCTSAYNAMTELYQMNWRRLAYERVDQSSTFYRRYAAATLEIKNGRPVGGPVESDRPWMEPVVIVPDEGKHR